MDDVLASIRKIVRTEHPQYGSDRAGVDQIRYSDQPEPADVDAPLELTPDMRVDDGSGETGTPPPDQGLADTAADPDPEVGSLTRDALRETIQEAVREILNSDEYDALIRSVLRDELLNGEIGQNVSENVVRLVKDEVGRTRTS